MDGVIEELLESHLDAQKAAATKTKIAEERLVFALQKLLFRDLSDASDWDDLNARLRKHGYFLKISLGGLSLHTETSAKRVCLTSELGFSYETFLRRFGPDQPRAHAMFDALGVAADNRPFDVH